MKLLFTGDVNFRNTTPLSASASYKLLAPMQSYFDAADYRIINLETPLGNENEYTPIYKAGPNLISSSENITFLKVLRADVTSLANNHMGDYGYAALNNTLALLDREHIQHCGAGKNLNTSYLPAVLKKGNQSVAIISMCENEFGIAKENSAGTAGYSPRKAFHAINQAKENNDYVIVFFHGGNEHNPLPSPATQDRYRLLCDYGADAVIATHTHCPQGYEIYNGKPIIYSMGNFLFKPATSIPNDNPWFYGYMVLMNIEESIDFEVIPYKYTQDFEYTLLSNTEEMCTYLAQLNSIIQDPVMLQNYFSGWAWLHMDWIPKPPAVISGVEQCSAGSWNLIHEESHHAKLDELFRIFVFKEAKLANEYAEKITLLQKMPI